MQSRKRQLLAAALAFACLRGIAMAGDVTIEIVGPGANAVYRKPGDTQPTPVAVAVGDRITWKNDGNRTHTATAETSTGQPLFDTGDIARGTSGQPVEMTQEMFDNADDQTGDTATIEYFCTHHQDTMTGTLKLSRAAATGDQPQNAPLQERREITTLDASELTAYRDAWRALQSSGQYGTLAGHHGCPDRYCHQPGEQVLFLPWHREYLLRLEAALGQPLHYWNWASSDSASTGIPVAFTDSTYTSGDGSLQPNPLRSFRYRCPATSPFVTTSRAPDAPFMLAQYGQQVVDAYVAGTYSGFNSMIENPPHDNLHGWMGGHMGGVTFAAYDPIFWAHHANVDRQWASWQQHGGPDPGASVRSMPLRGFGGRTVNDVLSISALGYSYDLLDTMPAPVEAATREVANAPPDAAEQQQGIGKTFNINAEVREAVGPATTGPLELLVSGLPEHPRESYFVYVFINQPEATRDDATPTNPHFAGTFAVFGGGEPAGDDHQGSRLRPVLELFAGRQEKLDEPVTQVTLVVTDESKAIVAREAIPFVAVDLRRVGADTLDARGERGPAHRQFKGTSQRESYDEAYRLAVEQAEDGLTGGSADRLLQTRVVSVTGQRGGIAGVRKLTVTIEAWLD